LALDFLTFYSKKDISSFSTLHTKDLQVETPNEMLSLCEPSLKMATTLPLLNLLQRTLDYTVTWKKPFI
jgi:hypothetical protein